MVRAGRARVVLAAATVLALAAVFLFPPFFVLDRASGGTRHTAIGHHPRWNPPTPAAAEAELTQRVGPPAPGVTPSPVVRPNVVHLVIDVAAILVVGAVAWLLLRKRGREAEGAGSAS